MCTNSRLKSRPQTPNSRSTLGTPILKSQANLGRHFVGRSTPGLHTVGAHHQKGVKRCSSLPVTYEEGLSSVLSEAGLFVFFFKLVGGWRVMLEILSGVPARVRGRSPGVSRGLLSGGLSLGDSGPETQTCGGFSCHFRSRNLHVRCFHLTFQVQKPRRTVYGLSGRERHSTTVLGRAALQGKFRWGVVIQVLRSFTCGFLGDLRFPEGSGWLCSSV